MSDQAAWVEPMLAEPTRLPDQMSAFRSGDWLYERKLDGLRCIAVRNANVVELWSRNRLSFNARFPHVATALLRLPVDQFVLDGEIVALDGDRTSFSLLQNPRPETVPVYSVFDLLHLLGEDIRHLALTERTALLNKALNKELAGAGGSIRGTERVRGDPSDLLSDACARGWEGLVAKRADGPYRTGRSPDWRKLKCSASQELVVGGWTDPSGARTGFGALLVGYYDSDGGLRYAGRVGTGFDERLLRQLHRDLLARERPESPFSDPVPPKGVHWARPELVAQVEFTEWTNDGKLRHPRFAGLRIDKAPTEVVRESP
jgi:DNA ligase D-like protein (predicted ligase)